ncbi:M57 family metalloprotease [Hymenobacter amundsenii]|uniref:M57 family metalloprotease n=1 Tax=Hymenobacter amundsenii TaxID=2006685 RepID=UPI002936E45D|nr:M57 family metalloprotease [Hymenobacter amundsenii]
MRRSYSNEGASTVGAVYIPGTPSGADPNSWMLACIGSTDDRPFNANDRTALNYVY